MKKNSPIKLAGTTSYFYKPLRINVLSRKTPHKAASLFTIH
jgi:hypothetical protein